MNARSFQSYFPDLDEQLQALQKDYLAIYEQVKKLKEEEAKRAKALPTVELVHYYQRKVENLEVTP